MHAYIYVNAIIARYARCGVFCVLFKAFRASARHTASGEGAPGVQKHSVNLISETILRAPNGPIKSHPPTLVDHPPPLVHLSLKLPLSCVAEHRIPSATISIDTCACRKVCTCVSVVLKEMAVA